MRDKKKKKRILSIRLLQIKLYQKSKKKIYTLKFLLFLLVSSSLIYIPLSCVHVKLVSVVSYSIQFLSSSSLRVAAIVSGGKSRYNSYTESDVIE